MTRIHALMFVAVTAALCASPRAGELSTSQEGAPSPNERVAAFKKSVQESQARLRQYEWIETTVISLKGEEKARRQNRSYYGADGKLQKVPIGDVAPEAQQGGGRRGGRLKQRIVENKKDEMRDYMEKAVSLVHLYVPPNPGQIQSTKDAGKMTLRPLAQGRVRIEFADFVQAGDLLTVELDGAVNRLEGLTVSTYLGTPEDPVKLNVRMGALADGTSFAAQTTLEADAKNIRVVIENSGHRPMGR